MPALRTGKVHARATAAGMAVANIACNQPMPGLTEADLPGGPGMS